MSDVASGSDNVIVLRLSEMYLTRAEALVNGATPVGGDTRLTDFNQTYSRAGLGVHPGPITMTDILNERRFEFAFEGHRWYDLTRTGEAINVLPNITSANQYLWPIPQDERDVNSNLEQNPGY
jgi:starch-binding outer membrane protein, SusD/RagB family